MTAATSKIALLALALACLAGCASPPEPVIDVRTVQVAVPIPCRETVPTRPAMPTQALPERPSLDAFVAAAIAEIELRDGYEGQLNAALLACVGS